MEYKPPHSCIVDRGCSACAFELGEQLAKRKPEESAKYVWMVVGSYDPCDIRRYAFSYEQAVEQLAHAKKNKYKDNNGGIWTLFKLVRVNKNP